MQQAGTLFTKLGKNDIKLIGRDSFLLGLTLYVLVICVILRFIAAPLAQTILENQNFDVVPLYPMVTSFLGITMGAILAGSVIGFLLLDEKDDNTLKAMLVTPVTLNAYLMYRIGIAMILGFILIIAATLLLNLITIPLWQLFIIAAVGSIITPVISLFLVSFAQNKVEGFAMLKIIGSTATIIIGAWFVAEPLQFLAGLYPPYWIAKAFWAASAGDASWWLFLVIGLILMSAVLLYFVRRFNRVAYE